MTIPFSTGLYLGSSLRREIRLGPGWEENPFTVVSIPIYHRSSLILTMSLLVS